MPFLSRPDADLFYTDEGSGPPVLMLHGCACDSHDWSFQIPAVLAAGYRVVAVDHRGHGRSSAPEGSYRAQVLAEDAAALLTELGAGPAIVIGHSMGTVVASALTVQNPELVRALVLVDPVYSAPDAGLAPALALVRGPAPSVAVAAMFEQAFYTSTTPSFLRTWHRRRVLGTPDHVIAGAFLGLFDGDDGLGRGAVAATYLHGRRAPRLTFHAREAGAAFERSFPVGADDEIQVYEGSGHFLHQERPEEVNATILGWLARFSGSDD